MKLCPHPRPPLLVNILIGIVAGLVPAGQVLAQGETLKANLVAYWPLDVIQGTKTPDLKSGYDLELVNLVASDVVPGHRGSCFRFVNSRQTLLKRVNAAGEGLPIARHPSFTVSLWANVNFSGQTDRRLFSEGNTGTTDPLFNIGTHNGGANGAVDIFIRQSGTPTLDHPKTIGQPFDGSWHHILFVQTEQPSGEGIRQVYLDGQPDPLTMMNRAAGAVFNFNTTSIGGILRATPSAWVTGLIDEVSVWNRALTAVEITDLFTNGMPSLAPPLQPLAIAKFESDFPVTVTGRTTRLRWDVTKDATITITPGIGNVTAQSAFGVGVIDVPLSATTTYTLTASRGAEVPVTRTLTATALSGVAAGWDWLENFEAITPGNLGGQGRWIAGAGQATVAPAGGNLAAKVTGGGDLLALPLLSRTVFETKKSTLFFRFLHSSTDGALPVDLSVGLTEKSIRGTGDFVTNIGTYLHFARAANGPLTMEARDGIGASYVPSTYSFLPDRVYNVWIDITNNPIGSTDTYIVHVAPEGGVRTTLFDDLDSDREPQEVVVLGSPLPDIHYLFLCANTANQAFEAVQLDDFYLSSPNTFSATVPIPSSFTVEPLTDLSITALTYQKSTGVVTLAWSSRPSEFYSIWASPNLSGWTEVATAIPSAGTTTSMEVPSVYTGPKWFFQVRR